VAPRGDTRKRIVHTASDLFRRHGYYGTGLNQILADSGAPRGSLYFHFPQGKEQLGVEAMEAAGDAYARRVEGILDASESVGAAIEAVLAAFAAEMGESNFERGCRVAPVVLDAVPESEPLRRACEDALEGWLAPVERSLVDAGWPREAARDKALHLLAAIEGALILARVHRDTEPLRAIGRELRADLDRGPA